MPTRLFASPLVFRVPRRFFFLKVSRGASGFKGVVCVRIVLGGGSVTQSWRVDWPASRQGYLNASPGLE